MPYMCMPYTYALHVYALHTHQQAAKAAEGSFIFLSLHVLLCCAGLSPQREGDPPRHTDSSSTTAAAAAAAAASASCASMPVGASCMETGAAVSSCGTALNPEWELVEGGGGQADWEFVDKDCPAADDDKVYIYLYMCV